MDWNRFEGMCNYLHEARTGVVQCGMVLIIITMLAHSVVAI